MTHVSALFSPQTNPSPADLRTFRLLCDSLFFYTLSDMPEQQKMWTGYTPGLLSQKEQTRFQSLVQEIKGHEAEFHKGFLASLSTDHGDRDEASVGVLASSLRSGPKPADPQQAEDKTLWQAMLILKLAEMHREEENEINQEFLVVSDKEAALFAAILGEGTKEEGMDEEETLALRELAATTTPRASSLNLTRLIKAWGQLYTRDPRATDIPLLVTTQAELPDLMAEEYEMLTGQLPRKLVSLILPTPEKSEEYAAWVEKFRTDTEVIREHFNRLLLDIAASGTSSTDRLTELQGAGNDLNRLSLPFLQGNPSKSIHFYAYEGVSLTNLFRSLIGTPLSEPQKNQAATGLLAVLR